MLSTDFDEFKAQMGILCAGYDKPVGERVEAYWKGLSKMNLIEFARCVEHALGESGPDRFPTTKAIWDIRRKLKAPRQHPVVAEQPADARDHLEFYANRLMLRHVMTRGGLGSTSRFVPAYGLVDCKASPELLAALAAKRKLVEWFTEPVREGDELATPKAFVQGFIKGVGAVSRIEVQALHAWEMQCGEPAADIPFPSWMARPLSRAVQPQLALAQGEI